MVGQSDFERSVTLTALISLAVVRQEGTAHPIELVRVGLSGTGEWLAIY
jgi:hypothetical protein